MSDVLVRAQVVIIHIISSRVTVVSMIAMVRIRVSCSSVRTSASNISLIELVKNRAATLVIDVADLGHDLDISKEAINQPERSGPTYLLILVRADLGSRRAFRTVTVVVPVLGCIRLVG